MLIHVTTMAGILNGLDTPKAKLDFLVIVLNALAHESSTGELIYIADYLKDFCALHHSKEEL